MKKYFVSGICLIAFSACLTISCNSDDLSVEKTKKEAIMDEELFKKSVSFMTPAEELSLRSTRTEVQPADVGVVETDGGYVSLFHFKCYRKSKGCEKGFGICDFKWGGASAVEVIHSTDDSDSDIAALLKKDGKGNNYIELLFPEPYENIESFPDCKVEEDVLGYSDAGKEATIVQGSYKCDSTLGLYGGYRIHVEL